MRTYTQAQVTRLYRRVMAVAANRKAVLRRWDAWLVRQAVEPYAFAL